MKLRVIASLTTRPPPYHKHFIANIKTLVPHFDAVYLGLPYKTWDGIPYTMPENLPEGVQVEWLDEDLGPARKIMGGLRHASEVDVIVTFDDDILYNGAQLRKTFENERVRDIQQGLTRVHALSGTYIRLRAPEWLPWFLCLDGGWHNRRGIADFRRCKKMTTISGYAGVAYPTDIFANDNIIEYIRNCVWGDKSGLLWRNDDIVLSAFVSKQGIDRVLLPSLDIGKDNKETTEPSLGPSVYVILDAARHPLVHKDLLQFQPIPSRLLLGDVVILFFIYMCTIFAILSITNPSSALVPILCLIIATIGVCCGYSKEQ